MVMKPGCLRVYHNQFLKSLNISYSSPLLFQIVVFGTILAAANAGLLHGLGPAVSSQSIIRHDEGHYAAPHAGPLAYAGHGGHYEGHHEYVR